jgi:hypothetical protein
VGGAVEQMQAVLADLRLWLALVESGGHPSMAPEQVAEAIGALEAGIAALEGDELAGWADSPEVTLTVVDEELLIQQIQESVMKRGVALPADVIALVLEAEEDLLYSRDLGSDEDEEE